MRKILYVFPLSLFFVACGAETAIPAGGNAGATDTGSIDTGSADTGSADTGSADTGSADTGSTDTGSTDTGSTDTGSTDTGSTDTGSTDTGGTDTGSTDTFLCADGSEIPAALRCNYNVHPEVVGNIPDCADGSDEANCPPFVCADGSEIPYELRCNYTGPGGAGGPSDCADGSDEANCEGLYFICQYGVIPYELVCDGMNDCPTETGMPQGESNSDELSCFTCSDGSSIPSSNVCDGGRRDCADGEDEASCP